MSNSSSPPPTGNPATGLRRLFLSFGHAIRGIGTLVKTQKNAQIHALATVVVMASGFFFKVNTTEWCLLLICMGGVWTAEAFNTALEMLTDLVSPEYHPLAGKAKDLAAGAVLLFAIVAALVASLVFVPKLLELM